MSERKVYHLTTEEASRWERLPPVDGRAWDFWRSVAADRGLNYRTILGVNDRFYEFTALPVGHRKPWCYPMPVKCKAAPVYVERA